MRRGYSVFQASSAAAAPAELVGKATVANLHSEPETARTTRATHTVFLQVWRGVVSATARFDVGEERDEFDGGGGGRECCSENL